MPSKIGYPQLSEATCYMITHVEKVVNTSTNSYMQVNVIALFQLGTVSLKKHQTSKINPPLKKTQKWTIIKDAMVNYSLAEFKNSIEYHSLFYRAEKKFCDENRSARRAMLLNNNHSRTYEVKDELGIFSVNTIIPSDPQTLQNLINEYVKYQNENWIQENAIHPWKAKKLLLNLLALKSWIPIVFVSIMRVDCVCMHATQAKEKT